MLFSKDDNITKNISQNDNDIGYCNRWLFIYCHICRTSSISVNAITPQNILGNAMVNNRPSFNGNHTNNIPQINGTINIKNNINKSLLENVSVPFLTAIQTAQQSITNGTIINGHIGATQGFLTYNFGIFNLNSGTFYNVIVDAGNGKGPVYFAWHFNYFFSIRNEWF